MDKEINPIQPPIRPGPPPRESGSPHETAKFREAMKKESEKVGESGEKPRKKRKRKHEAESEAEAPAPEVKETKEEKVSPFSLEGKKKAGPGAPLKGEEGAKAAPSGAVAPGKEGEEVGPAEEAIGPKKPEKKKEVEKPTAEAAPKKGEPEEVAGAKKGEPSKGAAAEEKGFAAPEKKKPEEAKLEKKPEKKKKEAEAVAEEAVAPARAEPGVKGLEEKKEGKDAVAQPTAPPTPPPQHMMMAPPAPPPGTAGAPPPPYTVLSQEMLKFFERMVGVMTVMSTSGIRETTVNLSAPQYASSPFFGAEIVVREYSTAPLAFNISINASPEAVGLLNDNVGALMQSFRYGFQQGGNRFNVNRIETGVLKEERRRVRRKEGGEAQ